jgi:hypothetical protein
MYRQRVCPRELFSQNRAPDRDGALAARYFVSFGPTPLSKGGAASYVVNMSAFGCWRFCCLCALLVGCQESDTGDERGAPNGGAPMASAGSGGSASAGAGASSGAGSAGVPMAGLAAGSSAGGSGGNGGAGAGAGGMGAGGTSSGASGAGGQTAAPVQVTVMSFNIRTKDADGADAQLGNEWAKRLPLARAVLADKKPAVVGLQESTASQVGDIEEGFEVLPATDVTVLYDGEQLEALEGKVVDIGNYGQMDPWGPRYCNWQRFRVIGSTAEFVFFNTHLSTAGDNVPQSKFVFDLASAWAEKGYPVVVVGDFNYDAAQNLSAAGFGDAMTDHEGTFHAFAGGRSGPRLDFIGLQGTTSLESAVDTRSQSGVYPSDHYPLWATLAVAPR